MVWSLPGSRLSPVYGQNKKKLHRKQNRETLYGIRLQADVIKNVSCMGGYMDKVEKYGKFALAVVVVLVIVNYYKNSTLPGASTVAKYI